MSEGPVGRQLSVDFVLASHFRSRCDSGMGYFAWVIFESRSELRAMGAARVADIGRSQGGPEGQHGAIVLTDRILRHASKDIALI